METRTACLLVIASFLLPLATAGCKREAPAEPAASVPAPQSAMEVVLPLEEQKGSLDFKVAKLTDVPELLHFPGKIALPDNESWHVGVLSSGRVERVYANLGDYVKEGTVLARMHSHDVHEAQAAYAMARSNETRATAAASLAQVNLDRAQRLYTLKAASVEQVEQARQELVNAKAELANAKTDVARNRVHLEDNLGIDPDAPLESGAAEKELIPIVAPASGYILQKNVTPGTTIAPGLDAFVIGDLNRLWMLASVGQESLAKIRVGQSAQITLPGVPGASFDGTVTNLGQAFDPTTRRLQIRIQLKDSSPLLHPEMLASAEVSAGSNSPMILIDPAALQQVNGQDVVFVRVTPDRFQVRSVQVGEPIRDQLPVTAGLKSGEEIVTRGAFLLKSQLLRSSMQGE
ncbi:MAG TPA: efflux RND transporter periplasmic adaptor subunit [Terracidiphilus sp.]|nr:efflux RND transporter periplasmic adaptor subunit [Terracidiphilus sp.]